MAGWSVTEYNIIPAVVFLVWNTEATKKRDSLNPRRAFKINDAHLFACQDFFHFSPPVLDAMLYFWWYPASSRIETEGDENKHIWSRSGHVYLHG